MTAGRAISEVTQQVDDLMRELYRSCAGELCQTLVADYSIAEVCRARLDPTYALSDRPIVSAARLSWNLLRNVIGRRAAVWVGGIIWTVSGLPGLVVQAMRTHRSAYHSEGSKDARCVLLRTGVANELLIARWIEQKERESVLILEYDEKAIRRVASLRYLPVLLRTYISVSVATIRHIAAFVAARPRRAVDPGLLVPWWFVLISRRAPTLSWNFVWAAVHLRSFRPRRLYFTMNYAHENAFRLALPQAQSAYVEHGFPRRDLPPLKCRQLVYSAGYADYLRSFDPELDVDIIGLDYFPKAQIQPTRTIVVASLQDWPQFRVASVAGLLNRALELARQSGWQIIFRTRRYDTDAFANTLHGPWDEISQPNGESFYECLLRVRPAMVWTTWSTAVLDARAAGVGAVGFVTKDLNEYFITDLDSLCRTVTDHASLTRLETVLRRDDVDASAWARHDSGCGNDEAQVGA